MYVASVNFSCWLRATILYAHLFVNSFRVLRINDTIQTRVIADYLFRIPIQIILVVVVYGDYRLSWNDRCTYGTYVHTSRCTVHYVFTTFVTVTCDCNYGSDM